MSEFQPSCQNGTPGFFNRSWSGWHRYQVIGAVETIILPCLIGIICSTGLVGNILIAFTIIRTQKKTIPDICICSLAIADLVHIVGMPFLIHQRARGGEGGLGSALRTIVTSLDACNQFTCSAVMTAVSLDSYTTSTARQRAMRLTKMVLALVSVSAVSAAPFHVIQLTNLQVSQLTLTFYVSYYISICLNYTSSSINPFPYILPTGNFQKCLRRCTKVEVRMAEQDVSIIENILKSSF